MTARWIVGIDGSEAAVAALRWTVGQGAHRDVQITAVGAYHVPAIMAMFTAKRGFGVDELGLEATAGHNVDQAIESVTGGADTAVPVEPLVIEGQAQHVLVDASVDADLLGHSVEDVEQRKIFVARGVDEFGIEGLGRFTDAGLAGGGNLFAAALGAFGRVGLCAGA